MNSLQFLLLFLCVPSLLYLQQAKVASAPVAVTVAPEATVPIKNPKTPEEFFARARQLSDLEAAGIPFHLKATYVATGDAEFTGNGTYEEWWKSKDIWRKEATLGDYKWVQIKNGNKASLYATSAYIPLRLRQAANAVEIQIAPDAGTNVKWKVRHRKLGGVDFTVLSTKYTPVQLGHPVSVVKEDYFTPEGFTRILRTGQIVILYTDLKIFQNLVIPRNIIVAVGPQRLLNIAVATLEPLNISPMTTSDISLAPKNLPPAEQVIHLDSLALTHRAVYHPMPSYPTAAKQQRIEGTSTIDATIDETGKIREPYVLGSAGQLLDDESLKTVQRWRYQPTMIDGKPRAVDTTISVKFALSQ